MEEHSDLKEKLGVAEEKSIQLDLLQKKVALREKEYQLETDQLRADKEELGRKLAQVSEEKLEGQSPKVASGSTPTDRQVAELQADMKRLRSNYEAMMRALKKKCDQYMHLQIIHQDTKEVLSNTETALNLANKKLADGAAQKKIKDLEARLAKSEEICAKLFESGMYWRQRRFTKEKGKIRVPIKGGGKKKPKKKTATVTDEENTSELSESQPTDTTLDYSTNSNSISKEEIELTENLSSSSTSTNINPSNTNTSSGHQDGVRTSRVLPPGKLRVAQSKPESRMDTFF